MSKTWFLLGKSSLSWVAEDLQSQTEKTTILVGVLRTLPVSTIDGLFAFAAVEVLLLTSEFKYYLNVNHILDSFPFIFHVAGYDEDGNNEILMAAAMNDHTIEQSTF